MGRVLQWCPRSASVSTNVHIFTPRSVCEYSRRLSIQRRCLFYTFISYFLLLFLGFAVPVWLDVGVHPELCCSWKSKHVFGNSGSQRVHLNTTGHFTTCHSHTYTHIHTHALSGVGFEHKPRPRRMSLNQFGVLYISVSPSVLSYCPAQRVVYSVTLLAVKITSNVTTYTNLLFVVSYTHTKICTHATPIVPISFSCYHYTAVECDMLQHTHTLVPSNPPPILSFFLCFSH